MDNRPYYYRLRGRTLGPVNLRQMRQLTQRAQVGRTTDVSRDGLQWGKAGDFAEIFDDGGVGEPAPLAAGSGGPPLQGAGSFVSEPNLPQQNAGPRWYFTLNGAQQGPVDLRTLQHYVSTGYIPASEHVIPEGGSQWITVQNVPELASAAPAGAVGMPIINTTGNGSHQQSTYQQPQHANGLAITGFVLSLIALPFSLLCPLVGLLFSGLAIVFAAIGMAGRNKSQRGLAIAGLVIGLVALALTVINSIIGAMIGMSAFNR